MKKFNKLLLLAVSVFFCGVLFPSCATLLGKSKYNIRIDSEPSNAYVSILDAQGATVASGITPQTFRLKSSSGYFKRAKYLIQVSKEGYFKQEYSLNASLDPNYIWNAFSWSLYGFLIDPATGAMWKLDEGPYIIPLAPKSRNNNEGSNSNTNINTNTNNINIIIKKEDLK